MATTLRRWTREDLAEIHAAELELAARGIGPIRGGLALPANIDPDSPASGDSPGDGDDQIRALKLAIIDLFGLPNAEDVTGSILTLGTLRDGKVATLPVAKGASPFLRLIGTEGSAIDVRLVEDAGVVSIQRNTNTEASPTWLTMAAFLSSGGLYLRDTANANNVAGLTINQLTGDDEIVSLKSSDIAHGLSDTETDTYGTLSKQNAGAGGLAIAAYREDTGVVALQFLGVGNDGTGKTTTDSGCFDFQAYNHDGTATKAAPGANANLLSVRAGTTTRFLFDAEGELHLLGSTVTDSIGNGTWYLGDTANANVTQGLTLNQGAADDQILALKSSDVAHGFTTLAETDTYASVSKEIATGGGLLIRGLLEASAAYSVALDLEGVTGTAPSTTPAQAARAIVEVAGAQGTGTGYADVTADGLVFGVRVRRGGAFVMAACIDEDGNIFSDESATVGTYDAEDDPALVRTLALVTAPAQVIRGPWDDLVRYGREDLVRTGILSEGGFLNHNKMLRLLAGACWQQETRLRALEGRAA